MKFATWLHALTEDTTPDIVNDEMVTFDDSENASKRVKLSNLATGLGGGDMLWAVVQASQLTNEIKNWPANIKAGDLNALNLWWHSVGTPSTAPTVIAGNDGGITMNYNEVIKVVADAASEGLYQRFTYADEPRVKSGRVVSALLAIWSVSNVSVTAQFVNSDTTHTDATAVTAAAWTIVKVENHTLAGTYCDLKVTAGAAGTFYVVPLGMNIGAKAFPLMPRPIRVIDDISPTTVVNGVDPGGSAGIDVNCTAATSNLCTAVELSCYYYDSTNNGKHLMIKRRGATNFMTIDSPPTDKGSVNPAYICQLDDVRYFTWKSDAVAGDAESCYMTVQKYWEWA